MTIVQERKSSLAIGIIILLVSLTFCYGALHEVESPDGQLKVRVSVSEEAISYSICFQGETIVAESSLGVIFRNTGRLTGNLSVKNVRFSREDQTYPTVLGKSNKARDYFNEMDIALKEEKNTGREIRLQFRAYNDGAAFRYHFPKQENMDRFVITEEKSYFRVKGNPQAFVLFRKNFTTSHEGNYDILPLSAIPSEVLIDLPVLFEYPNGTCVAISEANLTDYPGMYLIRARGTACTFASKLSPWPKEPEVKVKASTPHVSPWRVIMIADDPGRLIESNIIMNLNEPCVIKDTSWINPGKTTWHWWNGTIAKGVDFESGMNTATMKHYIDFCAANAIAFHALVDQGGQGWYGRSRGKVEAEDITTAIPSIDIQEVLRYANAKGVGIRLWVHWKPLALQMEKAFSTYEKWGVKGLMVDFIDRDDQQMVQFCCRVLECAARHRLKIQFHGAYKPTGIRRTYPNLVNKEGVMNLEYLKWSNRCTPEHNLVVPFTRMLAGPMDYHVGGFRSVTREKFKPRNKAPEVLGTRCHHLAMYVVYENPVQMVCDYPAAYQGQEGFDFLRDVPTTWDETRVINAKPGDFITIARRNGPNWYVGSMTDWTARKLSIPLSFLAEGEYTAEIYADAPDSDKRPNVLTHIQIVVRSSDTVQAQMTSGGGNVIRLSPRR